MKNFLAASLIWLLSVTSSPIAQATTPQPVARLQTNHSSRNEVLKSAQRIYIRTKSVYFKPATLENAMLKRDEFVGWGLAITREEEAADLIIEVDRKLFTTKFVYIVLDPKTKDVLLAGKVSSLGGTVEGKISDSLMKKLRPIRSSLVSMKQK